MTLQAGAPGRGGYHSLVPGPSAPRVLRCDLADAIGDSGTPLVTVVHLSDLHVCDAQSPARVEFLDRWADPDSPVHDLVGEVGTYRAQEILTTQVVAAMVRAVNAMSAGPVGGAPVDLAIVTGDNTDNAQANELAWYLNLLDGGTVHPDSGDLNRYEGVADGMRPDVRFWHPETGGDDLPRARYGFPRVPGLLQAVRRPFDSPGLTVPWLAVHGNHDQLMQGTWAADAVAGQVSTSSLKATGFLIDPPWDDVVALMARLAACDPSALATLDAVERRAVTPDAARRMVTRNEFLDAHRHPSARPAGHGFGAQPYYRHDHSERISFLVLDTVNEHGGWQGSLDLEQLDWLEAQLRAADADRRYVVLASHHPMSTLVNDRTSDAPRGRRVLGAELLTVLARHPCVVLWLNGHTHATAVVPHGSWWELTAPSLIDWPQQARVVEVLQGSGRLNIATTMLDHIGQAPWVGGTDSVDGLAGLSRELAANDWQDRGRPLVERRRNGTPADRDLLLAMPDPWA
ncbi:TIGR03767 family metallophosphoesterase [uncultured Jatrophihabitans sp.]|uniref:TIGR03767 family metallophosphoesterase n=1 Tax=uncultured Jatrophihabitans sp. TaxID=1610747 RepID=UPI0035CC737E